MSPSQNPLPISHPVAASPRHPTPTPLQPPLSEVISEGEMIFVSGCKRVAEVGAERAVPWKGQLWRWGRQHRAT